VSALVGLAVLLISLPLVRFPYVQSSPSLTRHFQQAIMVRRMVNARRTSVKMTDRRVRLLHEVLQGIRLLVLFVRSTIRSFFLISTQ